MENLGIHNPPYLMDWQNQHQGALPSNFRVADTGLCRYFRRYLCHKFMGVFDVKLEGTEINAPQGSKAPWPVNYFWYTLLLDGFIAVVKTNLWGVIMQQCTLSGFNIYYQPYKLMISNRLIKTPPRELIIGKDCVLIKMTPDFRGIMDKIDYYASLMALISQTAAVNLINSKVSFIFTANSRGAAESFKDFYTRLSQGEPAVAVDKKLLNPDGTPTWQLFEQNVGNNYIVDRLLTELRTVENMFATDIGLPNANTNKRERMIVDEVNANNVETQAMASVYMDNIKDGFEQANQMFGTNLSIDWRIKPQEVENEQGNTDTARRDERQP